MTATLKTTIIQEPSSATANMTLDTSGGVAFGQNLSVAGTTTLTGGIASAGLPLKGASSGTTTLAAQSVASGTVTIPAGTGTVAVNGVSTNIASGTTQASTSGTSITFTGIPAYAKRITVMFNGVSTNGTSAVLIQLGSGSATTTGYLSGSVRATSSAVGGAAFTTGFGFNINSVTDALSGLTIISTLGANIWTASGNCTSNANGLYMMTTAGNVTLSGALDRVIVTTVNGTDTFDAGSINIFYE